MLYKNSFKVLFSNFNLVWKSIIYHLFVFVIGCLLVYLSVSPIYSLLVETGFISNVVQVYADFLTSLNLAELFESINYMISSLYHIVMDNMSTLWKDFMFLGLTIFFVYPYLINLVSMPISNSLHYYMGSMTKHGFFISFSEVAKKNFLIQFVYYFVTLPFTILIILVFIFSLRLFSLSFAWSIFAVFIIMLEISLLVALRNVLFVAWIPTIVTQNYGIFKSLRRSIKNTFRKFGKVYLNMFYLVLTIVFINASVGIFTLMVGWVITIPASYVVYNAYGMATVYETQGMRYYIDTCNVVTPRKKEISDKLSDMKFII